MDLKGTRQFIVDEESAAPTINGVERMGIEADHSGICKFDSENSPGYESVFDAIQRYADNGPPIIAQRWVEEMEARNIARNTIMIEIGSKSIFRQPVYSELVTNSIIGSRGEKETADPRDPDPGMA